MGGGWTRSARHGAEELGDARRAHDAEQQQQLWREIDALSTRSSSRLSTRPVSRFSTLLAPYLAPRLGPA